jgi:hypothetical protein
MNIFKGKNILLKLVCLGLWITYLSIPMAAQLIQKQSIEIDLPFGGNRPEYVVIPIKTGGFIVQERNENVYGKKETIWFTKKYSSNMELLWATENSIPFELEYSLETLTNNALYLNFTQSNSSKVNLLKIELEKGDSDWYEGDLVGIQDIFDMKIVGNSAFYSGKFQGRAVVMGFSLFDKTVKVLNGLYSNHMEVVEIETDEDFKELHIYSKNKYKGNCEFQLRIFDQDGLTISNTIIEKDPKKIPFNGRLNKINDHEALMIGNYARFCDNFSQGIFMKKITDHQEIKSKFIDFSDFKNFFNYLNPKRQKKVKERLSKRKEAGKDVKFNYSMLVHKLYAFNNQLVMVAEIYYTETRNNVSQPLFINGRDLNPYNYHFTHTIICGFDQDGNMLWDNCLPMKSLISSYLSEQVQLSQLDNKLILAYPEGGSIKTQVIEADKTIREKEVFEVIPKKNSFWDDDSQGGLSAWHDQNFLFWGNKTVPDTNNPNGRKVFFISKLTYQL